MAERILLLGGAASELCVAAGMARDLGASVELAASIHDALAALRNGGTDLLMAEVSLDIRSLVQRMRSEGIAVPVLACGVNARPEQAVAAVRAGAYDYVPLPPDREMIAAVLRSIGEQPTQVVADLVGHRMDDVERALILQTLERCNGNRTSASSILGISVRTMRNKLRAFMDAGYPVSPAA